VDVEVGVLDGVNVSVAAGVSVAKRLEAAGKLFRPNHNQAPIAPHARIIPKIAIEILCLSKDTLSIELGVLFTPFLLYIKTLSSSLLLIIALSNKNTSGKNDLAGKTI
jgi:hypothetical protein